MQPLLMLQAYIDESADEHVYTMAGFVAPAERWAGFADAWQRVLDMPLAIEYFKMSEAMSCIGQFYGFSKERRNERIRLLDEVIGDYAVAAVGSVLPLAAFNSVIKDYPLPRYLTPYNWLFHGIIRDLANEQQRLGLDGPIDFIFDDQMGEKGKIVDEWEIFKRVAPVPSGILGSVPSFKDEKLVKPSRQQTCLLGFSA